MLYQENIPYYLYQLSSVILFNFPLDTCHILAPFITNSIERGDERVDSDVLDTLYKQHGEMIYRFIMRKTGNKELAEELTQETFYQAFLSYHQFRGDAKLSTWLCQIASHVWYHYLRSQSQKLAHETPLDTVDTMDLFDLSDAYLLAEEKTLLHQAIRALPKPMREVIYLRIFEEFSYKEIGDILNQSETWARTNFYRAKAKIQDYFISHQ